MDDKLSIRFVAEYYNAETGKVIESKELRALQQNLWVDGGSSSLPS